MIVLKIILGLMGLGVVVFIHEMGHFLAARAVGIGVEAFSIGWGKAILSKKIGAVEYRLGLFPIGGYCKMAGENDFEEAYKNNKKEIPATPGTFYGVKPWRRIITAFAGPFFNIVFAAIVFTIIWGAGFEYKTMDNRIVLAHDIDLKESFPADKAGLKTGDKIISINGKQIENYHDIQRVVATNAETKMNFTIERSGQNLTIPLEPELQKESGIGKIGVYPYSEPIIGAIADDSAAQKAGLLAGDRILKIKGEDFPYTAALYKIFKSDENLSGNIDIEYKRGDSVFNTDLQIADGVKTLGIEWKAVTYHTPRYSVFGAIKKGITEAYDALVTTIRSFRLLFRGIDITKSVSGPARITWMAGEVATAGFENGIGEGLRSVGNFLAIISIALGVTNLLPLPILDGGLIVLSILEIIKRKPLNPRVFQAVQTAGIVIVAALMLFSITGDIMFFAGK